MSKIKRKLVFKIYNRNGTFVKVLNNREILNDPDFENSVNGGLGELRLRLHRKLDDYGEGVDLGLNYRLKIYLTDNYNTNKLIYTGYLSGFDPYIKGRKERVEITFLPNISKLKNDYWRSSTTVLTGFAVQESATELGQIMQNIIDNYRTNGETDLLISNDYTNVDDTSETLTYLFKDIKHLDAMKKVTEFLPTDWYWYIDVEGKLHLKQHDSTATHKFIISKHIKELETHKNIESVINHFFIWSGQWSANPNYVDTNYSDATSKTDYGTIADLKIDSDIHTSAYADLIGNPKIAENKDPKRLVTIVLGSEYDLASIKPGDTCKIMGIDENQTIFGSNMKIVRIRYKVDEAILELTDIQTDLGKLTQEREDIIQYAIDQLNRNMTSIEPDQLVLGSRDWITSLTFSSTDHDTVSWAGGGSIKVATSSASAPITYSITAGNTGNMGATTVIYFQPTVSTNSLQTSTTFSDAMGSDRIALCYAVPAVSPKGATVVNVKPGLGMVIDGANIAVRTVLAEQIAANAITAYEINCGAINISNWAGDTSDLTQVSNYRLVSNTEKSGASYAYTGLDSSGYVQLQLDSTKLTSGTPPATGIYIDSTGIYGRYGGAYKFKMLTADGSAYFAGELGASTLTGTLRTSAGGDRIEITESPEAITFYAGGNTWMKINSVGIWFYNPSGVAKWIQWVGANDQLTFQNGTGVYYNMSSGAFYPLGSRNLGSSTYKWNDLHIGGDIYTPLSTPNIRDVIPLIDSFYDCGYSGYKWFRGYFDTLPTCPLPTANSAIDIFKKIKAPMKMKGKHGKRFYFPNKYFPSEMQILVKDVPKKKRAPKEEDTIDLVKTLGVSVQAIRELIEKVEKLENKVYN